MSLGSVANKMGSGPFWQSSFGKVKWFTRGSTLHELLAPDVLDFRQTGRRFKMTNDRGLLNRCSSMEHEKHHTSRETSTSSSESSNGMPEEYNAIDEWTCPSLPNVLEACYLPITISEQLCVHRSRATQSLNCYMPGSYASSDTSALHLVGSNKELMDSCAL